MDGIRWKGDELGRRAREDPRLRHFPWLGYSVVLVPMDVMPYRRAAAMMIGTFYGFKPHELIDLQARRIAMDGENVRTWWVFATPKEAVERRTRPPKAKRPKGKKKAKH